MLFFFLSEHTREFLVDMRMRAVNPVSEVNRMNNLKVSKFITTHITVLLKLMVKFINLS